MSHKNTSNHDTLAQKLDAIRAELLPFAEDMCSLGSQLKQQFKSEQFIDVHDDTTAIATALANLRNQVKGLNLELIQGASDQAHETHISQSRLRHDLRTPLNAVKGYSEMLLESLGQHGESVSHSLLLDLLSKTNTVLETISTSVVFPELESDEVVKTHEHSEMSSVAVLGKILVVDDDKSNLTVLSRLLEQQGHEVKCANSGPEALLAIRSGDFDLVLLDMLMPGMNGYEVLSIIKNDSDIAHLPVIVISALDEMEGVINCIEAGADDYLPKPFNPTLLQARIGTGIERKRLRDESTALMERMETELQEARRAQLNLVPHDFPSVSNAQPIAVHAHVQPAREVGGDFYDFFYVGENHLWFLVADVSDKGVAAGMFMARASSLVRLIPMQYFKQFGRMLMPHEVLNDINNELCQFNPEMAFITLLSGRIHIQTGDVLIANAGHSAALEYSANVPVHSLETWRGHPLGIKPDSEYRSMQTTLHPNHGLFLYTDGVTDALSNEEEYFSDDRLFESLQRLKKHSPALVVQTVKEALRVFTRDAEQFDDITLLAIQRTQHTAITVKEVLLPNTLEACRVARQELIGLQAAHGFSDTVCEDMCLCADEIISNNANFGYSDQREHENLLRLSVDSTQVVLEFIDDGSFFDPQSAPIIQPQHDLATAKAGGLGIKFVRHLTDELHYKRVDGKNHTVLVKHLKHEA